jgi:hypothetical protein
MKDLSSFRPSRRAGPAVAVGLLLVSAVGVSWSYANRTPARADLGSAAGGPGVESLAPPSAKGGLGRSHLVEPVPGDTGRIVSGITRVSDVHATADGWALLDGPGARVLLIEADGRPLATIGRPGEGPGELSGPGRVARQGRSVGVLDLAATRLDLLDPAGRASARIRLPAASCAGTLAEDLSVFDGRWLVLQRCTDRTRTRARVLEVGLDGGVSEIASDEIEGQRTDPFLNLFLLEAEAVYLGSTRSTCARRITGTGDAEKCVRAVAPLPVSGALRASIERRVAGRARSVGMELRVPDHLPPHLDVRGLAGGTLAVRRPLDDRLAAWVLEHPDGRTVTLVTPSDIRIEPGPAGILLLRQELAGLRFWVRPPTGLVP